MGKIFIIQPDERSSAPHPLLPPGSGIYSLDSTNCAFTRRAFRVFLNSPHPLEILSVPTAYGSGGTILRDHDSSNYLKAVNNIIRQHTKLLVRRVRKQRNLIWPLLASQSPHAWSHERDIEDRGILRKEIMSSVWFPSENSYPTYWGLLLPQSCQPNYKSITRAQPHLRIVLPN